MAPNSVVHSQCAEHQIVEGLCSTDSSSDIEAGCELR